MKKRVLICGATGFIGRNIAEYLSKNNDYEIFGTYFKSKPLNISNVKMLYADLTNRNDVNSAIKEKDIIIQAAATTSGAKDIVQRPHIHVTDNAVMNSLIFRAAHEQNVKQVLFFSCSVMYPTSDLPLKETDFNADKGIHSNYFGVGWTKIYIEKMCEFYSKIGDTKYTVLRNSNIYGPYDKFDLERSHVFGATVTKVMRANEGEPIIVWGNGDEERDLLYIDDLISIVELSLNRQDSKFEIFNAGLGRAISIDNLVKKIIIHSCKQLSVKHDISKPNINTKLSLNIDKANNLLGWKPKITLDDGIEKTISWYRSNYTDSIPF